ncbi:COG4223 family protein [Thalassovita aquimarina]|uniref:Mitochondrial inner membrane protein n=2 Tax=Thalassovita aquimarina TaxID=2785917 RepID=A0ABS5HP72_9RHOB|nr:hypothetical protein [Thalassovita aquimarina]MBR9650383.1 hypothetical protein [Thalassovita aquimarina]
MSDPKKTADQSEDSPAEIEDAVIADDVAEETGAKQDDAVSGEETGEGDAEPGESAESDIAAEPEAVEEPEPSSDFAEQSEELDVAEEADRGAEPPEEEPVEDTPVAPAPEPVVVRKGGFWPAILGGVIAAGIGAGGALYLLPGGLSGGSGIDDLRTQMQTGLAAQAKKVDALADKVDSLKIPSDPSADLGQLAERVDQNGTRLQQLAAQIDGYQARLTDMEKRPITESASQEVVEAYERELKALQQSMANQRSEIEDMLAVAEAKKAEAVATARDTVLRGALARIQVAMDTGASFAEPVSDLKQAGIKVPEALDRMVDGVPTRAALQEAFPDAARAALKAARQAETDGGALNFLRDHLGVRSLEPREGNDADAILSRAEAALKAGHLSDAMAELEALPEQGRVELTDWMALATQRADGLAAAEALSQQLMSN